MARSKVAHKPMLHGQGLDARKVRNGEGFMIYRISADDNNSKFYEGLMLRNDDGTYRVIFRYGALTDSAFTGRIMGAPMDVRNSHLDERKAKAILAKKYRAKTSPGNKGGQYTDAWKHKGPKGQYPVGLQREVGFGHGTQSVAFCIPSLRIIREHLDKARTLLKQGETGAADLQQMSAAHIARRDLHSVDSTMSKKIVSNIAHMSNRASNIMEEDYPDPKDLRNWKTALSRLISYIDKQLSVCHGKVANFNPTDIGKIKPPAGDPDEMRIVKDTDQRWFSEVANLYPSDSRAWDGNGKAPEGEKRVRKLAARVLVEKLTARWMASPKG